MNARLRDEYDRIRMDAKDAVHANEVHIDTAWGAQVYGVAMQVAISDEVTQLVAMHQKALRRYEPDAFLFPVSGLHISVNPVVAWNGVYAAGQRDAWATIKDEFIERFLSLDKVYHAFEITFTQLIATPGAIILCAQDTDDAFQRLRDRLRESLPFPAETVKFNRVIHTTVARYKKQLKDADSIYRYTTATQQHSVSMQVRTVAIREELVFPSLVTNEVAAIGLR